MILLPHRSVLCISGTDRKSFLQGLITNDINKLSPTHPLYAAMLSPQGKLLFDFLLVEQGEEILLDCWREKAQELQQRLITYKLRAKVAIALDESLKVYADPESRIQNPESRDPRHPQLGTRAIASSSPSPFRERAGERVPPQTPAALAAYSLPNPLPEGRGDTEYELHRLSLGIPDSADFIEDRSFPMEFGIADLHGISYTKGCYVGQEVVARSKTRGVLHKALYKVTAASALPASGTPVLSGETEIGQLRTSHGTLGLAILRIEEVAKQLPLTTAGISLTAQLPDWFSLPTPVINAL